MMMLPFIKRNNYTCRYHLVQQYLFFLFLDAAAVIAQTKHVLSKTELSVRYVPAPIPKEYDKNKLIVRDIHDKVDEEFFTVHIERCLGLESEEDFTTDFRAKTAIITFNESYTDKGTQVINYLALTHEQ